MLFHTWPFLLFFLATYVIFLSLGRTRFWLPWLLVASYFFYGWWNPLYLILIAYSTLLDYYAVYFMDRSHRKMRWLIVSLVNNLFLLGFYKYANFVTDNINVLLEKFGAGYSLPEPNILLPVGISFFTFQSMSYTIDFYRGKIQRETSLVRFATFVSFFPQLVAGPIERAAALLPQFNCFPKIKIADFTDGLSLFAVGLFKKIALANYLSLYVDRIYQYPGQHSASELLLATFAFAWQIYFDFSGYTDMARGVGRIMGFNLMLNFNNPYLASSLGDFWSRWHISLSTWFRDYVYIPLGGNRKSAWITYRNLLLVFVISGLWHGAAWKFIIWGALHGLGIALTRRLERTEFYSQRMPTFLKQLLVFLFVCFTWIFFRADNLADAMIIIEQIFVAGFDDPRFPLLALGLIVSVWCYQWLYETKARKLLQFSAVRVALVVLMILYMCLVPGTPDKPFIYFQF